ncbi:reverse transcriptase domain-containing protein, partial [Tanacetum coccineum]
NFDALLDEAMSADENSDSESDTKELPFEKITINTDYKIKTTVKEPPTDLELKPLLDNLEYVFLEEPSFIPVIISSQLSKEKKNKFKLLLGKQQTFLEVIKKEIVKLLDIVLTNENDELVPTRTVTSWRMPFGLCNAPVTFQRCMLVIFHDMIEESVEVFMDDFFVFGNSFETCLNNLDKMLQRCKDAHLVLNWEKCHFMFKEGIVLGHKVSSAGLEVDKAKIDVISKLPPPTNIKVFAFDKFRSYLILSKTKFHTDHSALRHLFKKQDAKPCLIRWILLLQEFNIEMKDRKGTKNVVADHLSQIKNEEISNDSEVDDNFLGETLMEINTKYEPWFVDFANYLVGDIIPKRMTYQQKNKFFSDLKHYFWEEP